MSQRLFYIYYICPRQDCQACFGGFCYIFSAYKMQYVFKSVFAKSKRAQEPTFLRSFFWCGRWDLNPHVIDTRTSNVPVCRFQHFRSNRIDCERYNTTIHTQKSSLLRKFYSRIAKKRPAPPEVFLRGRRAVYEEKRKWQIRRGSFRAADQGSATSPWQPPAPYRLQRHRGGRR